MSDAALPDDDELLAAELALGLIEGGERRAAEARLASDPAFRAAHARWQGYGVTLLSGREETPRPSLWPAILARLPANDTAPASAAAPALRWWQAGTAITSIAAVLLAVIAFDRAPPPPTLITRPATAPLVAVLTGKQGAIAVSFDASSGRISLVPTGLLIGRKAAELWLIAGSSPPRSLGVIAAAAPGTKLPPAALAHALVPGVVLAVSVEPLGGSPTGLPTGPVILTGAITAA